MKTLLTLLAIGMASCTELRPLSLPEFEPVSPNPSGSSTRPPISTSRCPSLEKKILGSWKCTTNRLLNPNGGSTKYSGRITLNTDMTLLDPDTLLGYKVDGESITQRAYELVGDSLILFVADRLNRQVGVIMMLQPNQCDNPKFINTGNGGVVTELTR